MFNKLTNNNTPPLLTIGIPTFNREELLIQTINFFLGEISRLPPDSVELIVSDNCSTDSTENSVNKLINKTNEGFFRYSKNIKNIGFDANVEKIISLARGDYVWLFSDDDWCAEGALETIKNSIFSNLPLSFAFVNYNIKVDSKYLPSRCKVLTTVVVDARELLISIDFANSLISSCIFSRESWVRFNSKKYFGCAWIHLMMARDILCSGRSLIIGERLVTMRGLSLQESRREKSNDSLEGIEFYMEAHLKFAEFASTLSEHGQSHRTQAMAVKLSEKEDLYQIINYKLTTNKYKFSQINRTWVKLARFRTKKVLFWLAYTPLLYMHQIVVSITYKYFKKLKNL